MYHKKIINKTVKFPLKVRYFQFLQSLKYTVKNQENILFDILFDGSVTEYGAKYKVSSINNIDEFQTKVPLSTYENLEFYIKRSLQGEQHILSANNISWFAKSAGTTGTSKYIPVTNESLENNHFKCGKDFLSVYQHNHSGSKLLEGKSIVLAGNVEFNKYTGIKNVGYISAILHEEKPRWIKQFSALDGKAFSLDNRDEKMKYLITKYKNENITSIAGVGPWIVLLGHKIEEKYSCSVQDIWPNLELILSGGVDVYQYEKKYKQIFGPKINIYNMYNASEGFFGFQMDNDNYHILLATNHDIFYEFISMDEFNGVHSKTITLRDVKCGINYAIVITTKTGLRRYILGDTVEFVSLDPYKVKITGRTKYYINTSGEQIYANQVMQAIQSASLLHHCQVKEYTMGPSYVKYNDKGFHEWIIEFEKEPDNIDAFTVTLDTELQKITYYYAPKRKNNNIILPPKIHIAPSGTFYTWMEQRGKVGGQHKIPHVWNDRTFLDQILKLI